MRVPRPLDKRNNLSIWFTEEFRYKSRKKFGAIIPSLLLEAEMCTRGVEEVGWGEGYQCSQHHITKTAL